MNRLERDNLNEGTVLRWWTVLVAQAVVVREPRTDLLRRQVRELLARGRITNLEMAMVVVLFPVCSLQKVADPGLT